MSETQAATTALLILLGFTGLIGWPVLWWMAKWDEDRTQAARMILATPIWPLVVLIVFVPRWIAHLYGAVSGLFVAAKIGIPTGDDDE